MSSTGRARVGAPGTRGTRTVAPVIRTIYGVDFSGARLAGRTTWVAACRWSGRGNSRRLRLESLDSLERLSGSAEREPALRHLVRTIAASRDALWAIGAPFGLPVEVLDEGMTWSALLRWVRGWSAEDGYELGLCALARATERGHRPHGYRATDLAARTPFDAYHYRIIYQTFHGMRDVLWPLSRVRETAILPFQHRRLASARRIAADPGGDALDAVIAAVGAAAGWASTDHRAVARDHRVRREGFQYW